MPQILFSCMIAAILAVMALASIAVIVGKILLVRTYGDLQAFTAAVETTIKEVPNIANYSNTTNYAALDAELIRAFNKNLTPEYQLTEVVEASPARNITYTAAENAVVFQSAKKDGWGNHYLVIFDLTERSERQPADKATRREFYITVVSAGPNGVTELPGAATEGEGGIESDDVFMLAEYNNGGIAIATINCGKSPNVPNGHFALDAGSAYAGDCKKSPYIF